MTDDGIGEYYARVEREKQAAWREVFEARERGASADEIRKLTEAAWHAGNTGD